MARKIDPAKGTAILNAARVVLLRDGYAAAKMSDIAAEAGVAPGTLYLYFDSKEALAGAIGEDFFARLSSEFAQVVKKLDKPNGVNVMVEWAVRIATEERDLLALLKQQGRENERPGEPGPKKAFRRHLTDVLQNLMEKDFVRQYDPEALAHVVMAVLAGIFHTCVDSEAGATIEPIKIASAKLLQHALFEDKLLPEKQSRQSAAAERSSAASKPVRTRAGAAKVKVRQTSAGHRR
jgi:AcrR family transcriptional regulator